MSDATSLSQQIEFYKHVYENNKSHLNKLIESYSKCKNTEKLPIHIKTVNNALKDWINTTVILNDLELQQIDQEEYEFIDEYPVIRRTL